MDKLIITAAIVGGITLPTQTPYLPTKPEQIAGEAISAANAGAAIVHIHARNPEDARPSVDLEHYKDIIVKIKGQSNVVIGISTGGGSGFDVKDRIKVVPVFKPEVASCNMGSVALSARPVLERYTDKDYKYPWEKSYIQAMDDFILKNTFTDLDILIKSMKKPEFAP